MDLEQDFNIELQEEEPPFLAGQKKQSFNLSPICVVRAPNGLLNWTALSSSTLSKERKELQHKEDEVAADSETKINISSQWNDLMADQSQCQF
ncbi:DEAH-box ATP-dependent RNA helicase prp22, partial [Elasticomyces elasticus]